MIMNYCISKIINGSFERKFAKNNYIDFYNVPTNALFWLRNHTEGSEERIFIINNNRQIKFY